MADGAARISPDVSFGLCSLYLEHLYICIYIYIYMFV